VGIVVYHLMISVNNQMEFYKQRIRRNHHHFLQLRTNKNIKNKIHFILGKTHHGKAHRNKNKTGQKNKHTLIHSHTCKRIPHDDIQTRVDTNTVFKLWYLFLLFVGFGRCLLLLFVIFGDNWTKKKEEEEQKT